MRPPFSGLLPPFAPEGPKPPASRRYLPTVLWPHTNLTGFKLRSRSSLIAATVLLQAGAIGLGWLATLHLARIGLSRRVSEREIDQRASRLAMFEEQLIKQNVGEIEYGNENWDKAQSLLETFKVPDGVQLFIVDDSGRVVCHQNIRNSPSLRRVDFSEESITLDKNSKPILFGSLNPGSLVVGHADLISGPAAVAVKYNVRLGAKIVLYIPEANLASTSNELLSGMILWCGTAGLVVLALTIAGSVVLVKRYDSALLRMNQQLEDEVERRTRRGLSIRNGLIFGLAKLADYRDTDTGKHLERISQYCEVLASKMAEMFGSEFEEIDRGWIERLKVASSMHDIGKVGIPDSLLLKPGRFTPEERKLMEKHPVIGADTLGAIRRRVGDDDLLNMGIQVTLSHHERWDGKGYPYGLAGDQIPLAARIVAVADVYDALTSQRVYKAALPHDEAMSIIRSGNGTQFDPRAIEAFNAVADEFDIIRERSQAEGADGYSSLMIAVAEANAVQQPTAEASATQSAPAIPAPVPVAITALQNTLQSDPARALDNWSQALERTLIAGRVKVSSNIRFPTPDENGQKDAA